ncbi:MAG: DUF3021 family protein [Oscillospiraceae bacterium]|nr:DUF3021 family protein [Oscillospiraceae bacterium]
MQEFIRFYSWGVDMKFHMGLYFAALVFTNSLTRWLMGERSIPIQALLEMILTAFGVAVIESWIFPRCRELEGPSLTRRTALWVLVCNLGFLGCSVAFGWFRGLPLWGGALLILFLEGGIAAMWFATHVALKQDSKWLNDKLRQYQEQ